MSTIIVSPKSGEIQETYCCELQGIDASHHGQHCLLIDGVCPVWFRSWYQSQQQSCGTVKFFLTAALINGNCRGVPPKLKLIDLLKGFITCNDMDSSDHPLTGHIVDYNKNRYGRRLPLHLTVRDSIINTFSIFSTYILVTPKPILPLKRSWSHLLNGMLITCISYFVVKIRCSCK